MNDHDVGLNNRTIKKDMNRQQEIKARFLRFTTVQLLHLVVKSGIYFFLLPGARGHPQSGSL